MENSKGMIKDMKMPTYSKGEEIFNFVSHICGGGIGVLMLISFIVLSYVKDFEIFEIMSLIIYCIGVVLLYTISSLYHGLKANSTSKKILRILDHCTIYVLIAGTYTPICVFSLMDIKEGYIILLLEWGLGILGIIINALWLNNSVAKGISMFLYAFTGWMIVIFPNAVKMLSEVQFLLILFGGVVYTVGILFYALGKKKKWSHSIFHILCVVATVLQFVGVLLITA